MNLSPKSYRWFLVLDGGGSLFRSFFNLILFVEGVLALGSSMSLCSWSEIRIFSLSVINIFKRSLQTSDGWTARFRPRAIIEDPILVN